MITRVKIYGFKSIKDLDIQLKRINILIGENGTGKSNFLQFFHLLKVLYSQRLQDFSQRSNIDKLFYFGRKITNEIYGKLLFVPDEESKDNNAYFVRLTYTEDDRLYIKQEGYGYRVNWNDDSYNFFVENALRESKLKTSELFRNKYLQRYFDSFGIYHFHDTSVNSPLRSASEINDNRFLRFDGGNLAAFLYMLMQRYQEEFRLIETTVRHTVRGFHSFDLSPDRLKPELIHLEWTDKAKPDVFFNEKHLSDGSLRFIALTTVFLQPYLPEIIIIDEPELGLHPFAIAKLAELIKYAAQRGAQVIISTQSATLVSHFEPEDIITVDKHTEGFTTFRRLEAKQLQNWLEDYSLGELWEKNVL